MSAAPPSLATWLVSAHPRGEVLTIEERAASLCLWLLGQPEGFSAAEIQGWLHDVAGVAHESASQDTSPQPIPVLLRHALSGLLFSHSEMWGRGEGPATCSVAFTSGADGIGIGWIGSAQVSVLLDNQPCDVRWVLVRDDQGQEARAWSVEAGRDVRITLRWQLRPGDADSPRVLLEARTRMESAEPEPAAIVAAPRFVPPASRRNAQAPEPAPVASEPEPVEITADDDVAALTGPSVEALFGAEPQLPPVLPIAPSAPPVMEEIEPADTMSLPRITETITLDASEEIEVVDARDELLAEALTVDRIDEIPSAAPELSARPAIEPVAPPRPLPPPRAHLDLDPDPARPSSGIARWLQKNFSWLRPRPRDAGIETPPIMPEPVIEPAAEQQEMPGIIEPPAAEPLVVAEFADLLVAPLEPPTSAREHEDEVARTAAALAEAIGGWEPAASPARAPARPVEIIADPSRIFEILPDRIPPTPEPEDLTARAKPAVDPHEIALPEDLPIAAPHQVLPAPTPVTPTAPPRLPSFVRPPVPRPDAESRLELDPHARLDVAPPAAPPGTPVFDPHERSFEPAENVGVTAGIPVAPVVAEEIESPIAAAGAAPEIELPRWTEPPAETAAQATDPIEEIPSGITGATSRRRTALHPEWPSENDVQSDGPKRTRATWIALGATIAVLFGVGWLLGSQGGRHGAPSTSRGPLAFLGFKGPSFKTDVKSRPDGAWVLVDGNPTRQRTPVTLELPPGRHEITLSFGQWGQAVYPVEGKKRETRRIDGTLWGSLLIGTPELGSVIAVAVDGRPRGFAPLQVDSLAPGPHQVRFSGPGMPSWGQTVEIRVAQKAEVMARTVSSPATGVLQVRANRTEDGESEPLNGARVWIDGALRGNTPLTLELARGPHSVRVEIGDDQPPVQMIDLPGGNQRFATFEMGTGEDHPVVRLDAPPRIDSDRPAVISATLTEVLPRELREMWLHVQGPDGTWSRYPMSRLEGQLSPVGAVAFPVSQVGPSGRASWYVSAVTTQGDEYFTELQSMTEARPASKR
jgi:hypothetical protein